MCVHLHYKKQCDNIPYDAISDVVNHDMSPTDVD